jgi:MscS family membrane protein
VSVIEILGRAGPLGLFFWQWLGLGVGLLLALLIGTALGAAVRHTLSGLAARTTSTWDDEIPHRLRGPLRLAGATLTFELVLPSLALQASVGRPLAGVVRALFLFSIFWGLWRSIDVLVLGIGDSGWARQRPASRAFVPLVARVLKVVAVVLAGVAVLSALGYPVASLLAGLGLGGLAFALAAQKTVENLFGSLSIAVDQPFRPGDFVKIDDFVGTVEVIGLRSTRIRTLDRTLITIPNGRLADTRVESFAPRDRIRLFCVLGLVYGTTAAQVRTILSELERSLREHPKIWPDGVSVRFRALADSALEIELAAWFQTADWNEFTAIRQELLLRFMEIVEGAGSGFAFPTRTVHLVADKTT